MFKGLKQLPGKRPSKPDNSQIGPNSKGGRLETSCVQPRVPHLEGPPESRWSVPPCPRTYDVKFTLSPDCCIHLWDFLPLLSAPETPHRRQNICLETLKGRCVSHFTKSVFGAEMISIQTTDRNIAHIRVLLVNTNTNCCL